MRRLILLLSFTLITLSLSAQEWVQVSSTNFTITSDAGASRTRDALVHLEQVRNVFGRLLNRTRVNRNKPLVILGLQNQSEIRTLIGNEPLLQGGYALATEDRNFLVLDLSATDTNGVDRALGLLMLDANYPRTNPWFDEGVAEYIAGVQADGKKLTLGVPKSLQATLQSGQLVPLSEVLAAKESTGIAFRATSWLLLRYLVDNGLMENAGNYFNQVMNRRVPIPQAFGQAFGRSPEEFDPLLAKFRSQALTPKPLDLDLQLDKSKFVESKVPEESARALQAELQFEIPSQRQRGIAELQQLLSQNPNDAEVHRGLAIVALRQGNMKDAIDYMRRAVEISDTDPLMHYLIAVWRNRGSREGIQVDSEAPSISLQAQRTLELDPDFAAAYVLLATAQVSTNHADLALQTIRKGMALSPRDESLLLTYASIELSAGKYDEARGLLAYLQSGAEDPTVAKRAGELFVSAKRLSQSERHWAEQGITYSDPTDPRWKPKKTQGEDENKVTPDETETAPEKPDGRKIENMKGILASVSCPTEGKSAALRVVSNRRSWTINTPDRTRAVLIGADNFDCNWKDIPVSLNYRNSGGFKGDLVSIEIEKNP